MRRLGLFAGVDLVTNRQILAFAPEQAAYIINRLKDYGILINTDGQLKNVLKLKPPIVFAEENADDVVWALDRVLNEDCLQA